MINIFIQVVRALSVICILVFVEELGISQTTQTVTGVVLIAVQSVLTGALAILIAVVSPPFQIISTHLTITPERDNIDVQRKPPQKETQGSW